MANIDQITYRAAYNSLALATLGACPVWDAAAKRFLAANCLQQADLDHGALSRASEKAAGERMRLEGLYGRNWRDDPRAKQASIRLVETDQAADNAWAEKFTEPFWQAIRDLVLVPAPTIAAAVFKAELIYAEEAWNDSALDADCMQIITADFARFADSGVRPGPIWSELFAAYERAKSDVDQHDKLNPPDAGPDDVLHEQESERRAMARAEAFDAMLLAPAPDQRALAKKLQAFNEMRVEDGWRTAREAVEQLAADARALLGEA